MCATDPQAVGLAGAAQLLRVERKVDEMRRGQVIKHTEETVYALTSLWPDEAPPERLLALVRDHWKIENGQHHRRNRTQDEDRCTVRETNGVASLDGAFERHLCRHPGGLIRRFMAAPA